MGFRDAERGAAPRKQSPCGMEVVQPPRPPESHRLSQDNEESRFPSSRLFLTTSSSIIQSRSLRTSKLFLDLMGTQSTLPINKDLVIPRPHPCSLPPPTWNMKRRKTTYIFSLSLNSSNVPFSIFFRASKLWPLCFTEWDVYTHKLHLCLGLLKPGLLIRMISSPWISC